MRRRLALALAACIAMAGCTPSPGLDRLARGEAGRVAQVRSGDVLVLDSGLVVRLAGVEAPDDGLRAVEARAALDALVRGRDVVLLYGGARRDPYGRALAHVRRGQGRIWLQDALLRDGRVRVSTYADNRADARPMLDTEARARMADRGLWVDPAFGVRLPDEATFGFQVVEGRIASVGRRGDDVALAFAGGRLSAWIPARAVRDFDNAGVAPARLAGRLVRVRGLVRSDRSIRLDHPEALELLVEAGAPS